MPFKRIAACTHLSSSIFNRFPVIQPVSSKVCHFCTSFAHFGLSWVRPWDSRGKCYMGGKGIQCWSMLVKQIAAYVVRPTLEYCSVTSVIWSPMFQNKIDKIERVQRGFTKRLTGLHKLSYKNRLAQLGLESLCSRRTG